jgi:hypothetical protein
MQIIIRYVLCIVDLKFVNPFQMKDYDNDNSRTCEESKN